MGQPGSWYGLFNVSVTSVAAVCFDDFAELELEVSNQRLLHPISVCCHWKLGVAPTSLKIRGEVQVGQDARWAGDMAYLTGSSLVPSETILDGGEDDMVRSIG
jgi:hypothetical protein